METVKQHSLNRFYSGEIADKLLLLEELYVLHGKDMLDDKKVCASLDLLHQYVGELSAQMLDMRLDRLCSGCASRAGGGCCSAYMEANSDMIQLLMNRLYGVEVVRQHEDANSEECCFLGESGCVLPIKPMFCLNYNCKHIVDQATQAEMDRLEQLAGQLLTEQTRLEAILLQKI